MIGKIKQVNKLRKEANPTEFMQSIKYIEKMLETIIDNENEIVQQQKLICDKLGIKSDVEPADEEL